MMKRLGKRLLLLIGAATFTVGWSQSLTWLGTLSGYVGSFAYGVSADG